MAKDKQQLQIACDDHFGGPDEQEPLEGSLH
jgi:hypothetical protein